MTGSQRDDWSIVVVRSGGFAGLKREWRVKSSDAPGVDWAKLIDACAWNDVAAASAAASASADRFVWQIEARGFAGRRRVTLADANLTGPWRELVDRVKSSERD